MHGNHRVLIPFELPDPDSVAPVVIEHLGDIDVVLLGHFQLPEQTPTAAGRDQFEAEAQAELDELAEDFADVGGSVTSRLVFGKARAKAIDRIALEEDCDVVLTPGHADAIDRILVPLRGEDNLDRIVSFVGELMEDTDASVTLYHAISEDDRQPAKVILNHAFERLVDTGVDRNRIDFRISDDGDPREEIVSLGNEYDVLVLGETEPSLRERILGELPGQVTAETDDPTFVVRDQ